MSETIPESLDSQSEDLQQANQARAEAAPVVPGPPPRADVQQRVSAALWDQLQNNPGAKMVRGLIRAEFDIVPPREMQTTDELVEWLAVNIPASSVGAGAISIEDQPPVPINLRRQEPELEPEDETELPVNVVYEEIVTGSTSWSRVDRVSGSLNVPVSILRRGGDAVTRYVRENHRDIDQESSTEGERRNGDSYQDDGPFEIEEVNSVAVDGDALAEFNEGAGEGQQINQL